MPTLKAAFYHIMLLPKDGVTEKQILKTMNLALDWFRLSSNDWVVYTTSDAKTWNERLLPIVKGGGNVFICRLDVTDRQGWVSKQFWEWLKCER